MTSVVDEETYFLHYGIKRRSGRYPYGSGKDEERHFPWEHGKNEVERSTLFLQMRDELRAKGMSDVDIAKGWGMNSNELRATTTIARNATTAANQAMAQRLRDKGLSNGAIAQRMGLPGESSVRALLAPGKKQRTESLTGVAALLREEVGAKDVVDVGVGNEHYLGVSRTQLDTAIALLKSEGYSLFNVQTDTSNGGNKTTIKVLAKPGISYKDVVRNKEVIQPLAFNKKEEGSGYEPIKPPISVSSKRLAVNYSRKNNKGEEVGGGLADGVIYVRPGVKDLSMGQNHYAQVRVAVDGTHYLKGMAIYNKHLPEGVDLVFNTNKTDTGNKLDALKPLKETPDGKLTADSFGSQIKTQILDTKGQKPTSAMNIVNEEGSWDDWSRSLASQMLSKQTPSLAREQLGQEYAAKRKDLDDIHALTNPAVKKKLLEGFADSADASAVHLQAKSMPRQRTQVILPVSSIKPTEVFAPNFNDGERVVLVRYPHGGTFEIPELTVNNRNRGAVELIGKAARDAIGIHPQTAERLSGADFDGDTVLVIPNNSGKVKSKPPLKALVGFDPKRDYPPYDGMRTMDGGTWNAKTGEVEFAEGKKPGKKQTEMGKVSNLITDMTIKGATDSEIARAVKHSMVVIDAEKHHLDYKRSAIDNGISKLKEKYQGGSTRGASTLISRTTSEIRVPDRKQNYQIDPATGKKIYRYTGDGHTDAKGRWIPKTIKSTIGGETEDAHKITSAYDKAGNRVGDGTPIERIYADHANRMKALANEARKADKATKALPKSPSAAKVYDQEVKDLNAALLVALKNAPRERQAQLIASSVVRAKRDADPTLTPDQVRRENAKALEVARARLDAKKQRIDITPRQWEAIQAGAISNHKLEQILNNADLERVQELATPRQATVMTSGKRATAQALLNSGRTAAEVATILGVSVSTLRSSMASTE